MFLLCSKCHDQDCPRHWVENILSQSRGPCEGCGKVGVCVDCQGWKLDLPVTDERPEERLKWKCRTCNQLLNPTVGMDGQPISFRHANDGAVDHKANPIPVIEDSKPATLVCDFCSTLDPMWVYPCVMLNQAGPGGEAITGEIVAFKEDGTQVISFREDNPDFLACQDCHDIIESGDQVKLAIRSVELFQKGRKLAIGEDYIINLVTQVHSRFWQTRNGPAQAVTVPQEDT